MADDLRRERDWDRTEWAGSVTDKPGDAETPTWNKTEWVGDQGEGAPEPIRREDMPEGDTSITGNRHPSGEQHWADTSRPVGGEDVPDRD